MRQQAAPVRRHIRKHIRIEQVLNTASESFMLSPQSYELPASAVFRIAARATKFSQKKDGTL
jgi:hypothetical protein